MTSDGYAGAILAYSRSDGPVIARLDCVGTSPDLSLLDASRPFNLRLSLRSDLAHAWAEGREIIVMMEDLRGWHQVDIIGLLDELMMDPKATERGMATLTRQGYLRFKVMANLSGTGITEEDVTLTDNGFSDQMRALTERCSDLFE